MEYLFLRRKKTSSTSVRQKTLLYRAAGREWTARFSSLSDVRPADSLIYKGILYQLEIRRAFLDSSLSLKKLSVMLETNQTYLSNAVNRYFGCHLKELLNRYRVEYAKELLRNGVSKKLLWTEYMEDCRANGEEPLMYSQFCYHIQQDEQKHRATMHINRKPGEQVEVDWAGDPATVFDLDTGEIIKAYIFVGVMTYSQYAYVEAFLDMKQKSWINAHVHMYEYFGGVA